MSISNIREEFGRAIENMREVVFKHHSHKVKTWRKESWEAFADEAINTEKIFDAPDPTEKELMLDYLRLHDAEYQRDMEKLRGITCP